MRVCAKHFKPATEVLRSLKTGEEFDLCGDCEKELRDIIYGRTETKPAGGKRVGRPAGKAKN